MFCVLSVGSMGSLCAGSWPSSMSLCMTTKVSAGYGSAMTKLTSISLQIWSGSCLNIIFYILPPVACMCRKWRQRITTTSWSSNVWSPSSSGWGSTAGSSLSSSEWVMSLIWLFCMCSFYALRTLKCNYFQKMFWNECTENTKMAAGWRDLFLETQIWHTCIKTGEFQNSGRRKSYYVEKLSA